MQIFFNWFYMQLIVEGKKSERIPVSHLFPKIKALGAGDEKQKADGERGETQAGQRVPRAAALFSGTGRRRRDPGGRSVPEDVCLFWGVRSEATDAPPRAEPRRGTEGGPLVYYQAHTLWPFVIFSHIFCDFSLDIINILHLQCVTVSGSRYMNAGEF